MPLILKFTDLILCELITDHRKELDSTRVRRQCGCDEIILLLVFRKLIDYHLPQFYFRLVGITPLTFHLVDETSYLVLLVFHGFCISLFGHFGISTPQAFRSVRRKLLLMDNLRELRFIKSESLH